MKEHYQYFTICEGNNNCFFNDHCEIHVSAGYPVTAAYLTHKEKYYLDFTLFAWL